MINCNTCDDNTGYCNKCDGIKCIICEKGYENKENNECKEKSKTIRNIIISISCILIFIIIIITIIIIILYINYKKKEKERLKD